jgi:diguanylate cyclase (GGDEF)-like protein
MTPDARLDQLVDAVVSLASGRLDTRIVPSSLNDEIDAISVGVNMLAEELEASYAQLERRVEERTLALEAATGELKRLVLHDPLTDLPNRRLLVDRIDHALEAAPREEHHLGVLFVDVDRFKAVNDSLGHLAGDKLLIHVGQQLRRCVRPGDTVARIGGDEFVLVCLDLTGPDAAVAIAERVHDALAEPCAVAGQEVSTSASIGIAMADARGTAETLLRNSDAAMYVAKNGGRGRHVLFHEDMAGPTTERFQLESDLRRALANDEIEVHYQPLVDVTTGQILEVEALVRWSHPQRGMLAPAAFLDIAQECGLLVALGRKVLRQACVDVARLREELARPDLKVCVNLSAAELAQRDLTDLVVTALHDAGLEPSALCLELTETGMIAATVETITQLEGLKQLGVTLALDDFGTGFSSLTYLQRFPVDMIKTDRSFITDMCTKTEDATIVAAVVGLARALGLRSVAEGVETEEQLSQLREIGCDLAQGYYFARPLSIAALRDLLQAQQAPAALSHT